jgi:hypothetical protein
VIHCFVYIPVGRKKERMKKKLKSVHHRIYTKRNWILMARTTTLATNEMKNTHTHFFWLLPSSFFSVSLISYFSLGVSMSWGKNSLDVFLPFFCENQQLPPFFPSSSFLLPPLSAAGLCCWADERAEAFEFGYLIVLAFGSYACVCNAYGACLTR